MATTHRVRPPPARRRPPASPPQPGRIALWVAGRVLRIGLTAVVVAGSAILFALALIPSVGTAGRLAQEVSDRFMAIGADVDLAFPRFPERSTIYARDGSVLATLFFEENRKVVRLEDVSEMARGAVLAIEDSDFYGHRGVDPKGILRALLRNITAGEIEQGASTITQQLVRNVFPTVGTERTLERKIAEARLAMRLEQEYTKDEILELYLNEVYFGRGVYGIATAAEYYFSKRAADLSLEEAALLAGLIARPEAYNPERDRDVALWRRNLVIDRMVTLGYASPQEATRAKAEPVKLRRSRAMFRTREPYFVDFIKREILGDERFGKTYRARKRALFQGGLQIHTTLDPRLQKAGAQAVKSHLPLPQDPQSAVAVVDARTGAIRALVSSTRFRRSQVNLATGQGGSGRQSGSAFKPFTLVAAFMNGFPATKVYDSSSGKVVDCTPYGPSNYRVVNADGGGRGYVDLWTATQSSINAVFVQLAVDVGPDKVAAVARRMGIESSLEPPVCSITLGTKEVHALEMASAFATIANEGKRCERFGIIRVLDRDGATVVNNKGGNCRQVIPKPVAALVANMLQRVVTSGTGRAASLGQWPAFGKTGTTNDYADAWFVGCTRQFCGATWVGHAKGRIPMTNVHGIRVFGGTFPARIWRDVMLAVMQGKPAIGFPPAPGPTYANVPDVVGKRQAQAERILRRAKFTPKAGEVNSLEPAGTVVAQAPAGGARVPAGGLVTIKVSNGKAPRHRVPDVVGLSERKAKDRLHARGFKVAVDYGMTDDPSLDGRVFDQSPPAGVRLKEGQTVAIAVYKYEPPPGPGSGGGGGEPPSP